MDSEWVEALGWIALIVVGCVVTAVICEYLDKHWPASRAKPDGYVGRFRHPNGTIVHVARVNGELMVISEEKPDITARDLGNVSGRELATWHKLSTTPDGKDSVTRPN